jgi:uncharacterized iron-regulated protein
MIAPLRAVLFAIAMSAALPVLGQSPVANLPMPPAPPWTAPLAQRAPLSGQIREPASGRRLTPEQLNARLAAADFVLLGERHDNPDHHRLQAWAVEFSGSHAVALEMIDSDQAARLSQYLTTSPRSAEQLGNALDWANSGWPHWSQYQPIVEAAMRRGLPVLAANLPPALARAIARDGLDALPAPLAAQLRLDPAADKAVLAGHAADMQAAHCGKLPERSLAPFAVAQYARDGYMAWVMADQWRRSERKMGVVLIAGAGHARKDRGVPLHLARLAPDARVVSLAFVEAADGEMSAADLALLPYDVVWFTARVDDDDPCNAMPDAEND